MRAFAEKLWERAKTALSAAEHDLPVSCDAAASRAYYAAFFAVSALFALEGKQFSKHSAVNAAVHRDLVRAGRWTSDLGRDYSYLMSTRDVSDYGGMRSVSLEEAKECLASARRILGAVIEVFEDTGRSS